MNVVVADDHPLVRGALCALVAQLEPRVQVHQAVDFPGLLREVRERALDLAVVDLHMPGMEGLAGVAQVRAHCPRLPVLVLSGQTDSATADAALAAGASAFVPKTEDAQVLLTALQRMRRGIASPTVVTALAPAGRPRPTGLADLTPRQQEVLRLLVGGAPNREIGLRLGLAEGTVKLHVAAILRVLRVRNRTEAVARARSWIDAGPVIP